MTQLAHFVVRFRKLILVTAGLFVIAAGVLGGGVAKSLSNGGFADPQAESVRAAETLSADFGVDPPSIILIVRADSGTVDDPANVAAAGAVLTQISQEADVTGVASYWTLGSPPSLRSNDGTEALAFVSLTGDQGHVLERSGEIADVYRGEHDGVQVMVGGTGPMFSEIQNTIESDLTRAESIAFPITLVLLLIVFGSLVAASLPLGVGVFSIVGTFLALELLTRVTEVSIFALNLTTALGLGLAIDYALFVVSRFREELGTGWSPQQAAERTVLTAGRTVLFSAGTVAVSLAAMLVFPLGFLRSFGYAGIAVVALAAIGAVVVLPAALATLGHRIEKLRVRKVSAKPEGSGVWHRVATAVMRRPIPIATAVVVLLAVLGSPFFAVRLGQSDDRALAPGSAAREVGDALRSDFDGFEASAIEVVVPGGSAGASDTLEAGISGLAGVARVDGPNGSYIAGNQVAPPSIASARFVSTDGYYAQVIPSVDPGSAEAERLVRDIRGLDTATPILVGGQSASLVDTKASVFGALPWALGIIAVVTFVVLFMMFGSLLVPAKAVVLNLLSLSATFGALVWVFQEGHLSGLLGFTPTGSLDLTMPILMFCISFGLSMDYEVFLLSRIKEEHDRSDDNVRSVALGLERTGRIVTAAAVLIAVVFVAFGTSRVTMLKMFGMGMTLAVLVDAFLIRATLVPAFMRLAGRANWWAPAPLRRFYRRFGFAEAVELEPFEPKVPEEVASQT